MREMIGRTTRVTVKFKGKKAKIKKHPSSHRFHWEEDITEKETEEMTEEMREFETGATRGSDDNKPDYEGFFSSLVFKRYGEYMNKHRVQANGEIRDSDNWQKGIPISAYIKSWWRHFIDVWSMWRRIERPQPGVMELKEWSDESLEIISEALCAALFNNMGMLHEVEKERKSRA